MATNTEIILARFARFKKSDNNIDIYIRLINIYNIIIIVSNYYGDSAINVKFLNDYLIKDVFDLTNIQDLYMNEYYSYYQDLLQRKVQIKALLNFKSKLNISKSDSYYLNYLELYNNLTNLNGFLYLDVNSSNSKIELSRITYHINNEFNQIKNLFK